MLRVFLACLALFAWTVSGAEKKPAAAAEGMEVSEEVLTSKPAGLSEQVWQNVADFLGASDFSKWSRVSRPTQHLATFHTNNNLRVAKMLRKAKLSSHPAWGFEENMLRNYGMAFAKQHFLRHTETRTQDFCYHFVIKFEGEINLSFLPIPTPSEPEPLCLTFSHSSGTAPVSVEQYKEAKAVGAVPKEAIVRSMRLTRLGSLPSPWDLLTPTLRELELTMCEDADFWRILATQTPPPPPPGWPGVPHLEKLALRDSRILGSTTTTPLSFPLFPALRELRIIGTQTSGVFLDGAWLRRSVIRELEVSVPLGSTLDLCSLPETLVKLRMFPPSREEAYSMDIYQLPSLDYQLVTSGAADDECLPPPNLEQLRFGKGVYGNNLWRSWQDVAENKMEVPTGAVKNLVFTV